MASNGGDDLARSIRQYGEIADAVNKREMKRFIEEARQKWTPELASDSDHHYNGYTDEGAFALHVYQRAFSDEAPERPEDYQVCEAEEQNQVLLRIPIDSLVDEIDAPLSAPASKAQIDEKLNILRTALQRQVAGSEARSTAQVELPSDLEDLMVITNGINGAGVPAETNYTQLVYALEDHKADDQVPETVKGSRKVEKPLAAWRIGGSTEGYRYIYYVLCPDTAGDEASWKVVDVADVDIEVYDSMADFIRDETRKVQDEKGGAQLMQIL